MIQIKMISLILPDVNLLVPPPEMMAKMVQEQP
jgi:hypothetical protein